MTHPSALRAWDRRRIRLLERVFQPRPRLSMSQWADQYRVLSRESSAEPGRWRTDRVPYLREIMDAVSDPLVREVVLMKSAQIGYTQGIILNAIGYFMHQEPSPMLVVQPSDGDAENFSKEKLAPMLRDVPEIGSLIDRNARDAANTPVLRARDSANTILGKSFPGGYLAMSGATSPKGLAARSSRVIFYDEVDRYPASAGPEGDPIKIADKRSLTFHNRKSFKGSTPLLDGVSRIQRDFKRSDQRLYHVPCPHCGTLQPLIWGGAGTTPGLTWRGDDPSTVHYVCEEGCVIEERWKLWMNARGAWRATNPASAVRGYHISALNSPFDGARWPLLVQEWLDARGTPEDEQVFWNTVLGLPYVTSSKQLETGALVARRQKYAAPCPAFVGGLVRAVDVQGNRLETAVWGFGAGEEAIPVEVETIEGDPGTPDPWAELEQEHLPREYAHERGGTMVPRVVFIDSGGHHTEEAYAFAEKHRRRFRTFAIKGMQSEGAPIVKRSVSKKGVRKRLLLVGVFTAKESLMSRLGVLQPGPRFIHIPDWYDEEHIKQLLAEKLERTMSRGQPRRYWAKVYERNEQLDLFNYCLAALHFCGKAFIEQLGALADAQSGPLPAPAPGSTTESDDRPPSARQSTNATSLMNWDW